MNSPINRIIELTQSRDAAKLKSTGDKPKSLNDKVVELVASANKMALPERHVIPRHALVVMARAMKELSSLSDESREAGVLREVTKFISLSQNTVGSKDRYVKHTDLLPAGHPMSDHNSSLSLDDFLEKYSTWISADPGISEDARQLVAAAYSQMPDTLEREHAFIRLRALRASSVPSYIKLDGISALVAAFNFGDGNSSAARRARVALQWRDRFGRWVEMGRGINFKFRLPDGGVGNASGTYVGSDANAGYSGNIFKKEANAGYVEVKGNENVPDGIYSIRNNNAEVFKARLSEAELDRAGVDTKKSARYKMSSQFDESIPDLSDLLATKVDAPSGWTKNEDGSFTSDDDYKVIPNKDGYAVHRLDPDGNTGEKVADAKTWADAQSTVAADEDAYDKYKEDVESGQLPLDDGTRPEPRYSRMNRDVQREIKQLKDQVPQNQESNERIETQLKRALSGKDSQGRDLPDGWYSQIDPNTLDETYYKDIPGATRSDEYLVAVVARDGDILYGTRSEWFNNGKRVDSWDKVTADSPKIIDQINRGRERIGLEPISPAQETKNIKGFDVQKDSTLVAMEQNGDAIIVQMPNGDLVQYDTGGPEGIPFSPKDKQDFIDEVKSGDSIWFDENGKTDFKALLSEEKDVKGFKVPKDSKLVAVEQNGDAIIVQLPDGSLVQYDTGGPEGLPLSQEQKDKFISDVKSNDTIWFDETGRREWKALLEDSGPDEPPSPPGGDGGSRPKSPAPSSPAAPALFREFDVPAGAFQLRTVEYEPEGRVDERSTDFTDDPAKIATRYPLDTLVRSFTKSLIGDVDESVIDEIVDINDDGDGNIPDLSEVQDALEQRAPRANIGRASGAGSLEFNAGEEFVQAEVLYNAVWLAGGDPNRVIANAYDSVNGNRSNLNKLIQAQGGIPSPEDEKLIVDIKDEIKSIEEATPDNEEIIANINTDKNEDDMKFSGALIENIPVDFKNPDYYEIDLSPYIPTILEPDELGYTDNPKYIAVMAETADLIQQMQVGITDGSGAALIRFGDGSTSVIAVEAIRDALQYQGINTNDILFKLRDESNDMSKEEPQPESTSLIPEQISNQKIKDKNGGEFELNLVKIGDVYEGALINNDNNRTQIVVRDKNLQEAKRTLREAGDYIKQAASGDEAMDDGFIPNLDRVAPPAVAEPQASNLQAHSRMIKDLIEQAGGTVDDDTANKIRDVINEKGLLDWSEADDAEIIDAITEVAGPGIFEQAPAQPAARRLPPTTGERQAPQAPAPETPALVLDYPGPRKKGYSSENTTLDRNGNVVGEGSTVQAVTDGKTGRVLKIQDSPAYLKIEFTDGTTAVRSANKIVAISNKDGSQPSRPSAATAPSEIERDPVEISRRLDTPVAKAPAVARSGDTYGVNDESTVPDSIKELTQVNVAQKDFAQWGVRDAEIAKAATGRVGVEPLYELIANYVKDTKKTGDDKPSKDALAAANSKIQEIIADTFGDRTGVSFGSKFYTVTRYGTGYFASELVAEEDNVGKIKFEYSGKIRNESGNPIGTVTRAVTMEKIKNQDGTFSYKIKPYNSYMKVDNKVNQKSGFGSAYNRYMENWYIANNTEQVKVFAAAGAAFEGGFVWALNGFDWDLSRNGSVDEIKYALSRLRRESETVYEKAVADILIKRFKDALDPVTQKYDASRVPTPMDVALAGWREGSTNWPGRRAMLDTGWHGVKNLVPSAREQVQAINYRKIKNAERRVKTGQNKPNLSSATLSYLNSNEFQTEHAALGTSMDIIRSVLRNNESLAMLSESDKVKLNNMVTKEIFSKDSKIPTGDIYRLRTALIKEYSADYSSTDPFSVAGEALTKFSAQQFEDGSELEAAGFKVEILSDAQGSGINETYRVTHNDSGQVFYVKNDATTRDRINERRDYMNEDELDYPTIVAELEASVLFNLSGLLGSYSTRGSTADENLIIMSSAGATLPTYENPINASDMFSLGLNTPSGQKLDGIDGKNLVDNLKNPEDVFRVHIVDALMLNMDRHSANWKAAIDLVDNKILAFPVDNTLTDLNVNDAVALASTEEFLDNGLAGSSLYRGTVPAIIDRAGKERAYEVYKNEVQRIIENINDPLVVPKENELAFLISKWGSYDAFKDAMKKRLSAMIEDGTDVNTALRNMFNRRRG